mmetsp:Transcript_3573/g.8411  ORF Transcript_3573/g.8411 Transcript_3573/m.8411 type:complete len:794 (-) Transcript_3573:170-2551(-)
MARRRQAQRTEPSHEDSSAFVPVPAGSKEAMWESCLKYDEGKRQLSVGMAGWGMADEEMDDWCTWFGIHLPRVACSLAPATNGGDVDMLVAREVNFAENRLSGIGAKKLLETLSMHRVVALVLKLHHNQLEDGSGVAGFVSRCSGVLRELHLSHNELDTAAAAQIVVAAAAARDLTGEYCYPRQAGNSSARGAAPMWLRLEQNYVDPALLAECVDPAFARLRRPGRALCNVSSKGCSPHCCSRHRSDAPAVHAKHLANQRRRPTPPGCVGVVVSSAASVSTELPSPSATTASPSLSDTSSSDMAASVTGGSSEAVASAQAADEQAVSGSTISEGADGFFAEVLRWDETLCRWVQDFIEVPPLPEAPVRRSSELRREELMARELKQLIGIGRGPAKAATDERELERTKLLTAQAQAHRDDLTKKLAQVTRAPTALPEELAKIIAKPAPKAGRRGLQPTGSKVTQANSPLNPQAREFVPAPVRPLENWLFASESVPAPRRVPERATAPSWIGAPSGNTQASASLPGPVKAHPPLPAVVPLSTLGLSHTPATTTSRTAAPTVVPATASPRTVPLPAPVEQWCPQPAATKSVATEHKAGASKLEAIVAEIEPCVLKPELSAEPTGEQEGPVMASSVGSAEAEAASDSAWSPAEEDRCHSADGQVSGSCCNLESPVGLASAMCGEPSGPGPGGGGGMTRRSGSGAEFPRREGSAEESESTPGATGDSWDWSTSGLGSLLARLWGASFAATSYFTRSANTGSERAQGSAVRGSVCSVLATASAIIALGAAAALVRRCGR